MEQNRRYSAHPSEFSDENSPEDPEGEPISAGEYYSEDFEQDDEFVDEIQDDLELDTQPLPPPYRSPRSGRNEGREAVSEDAILVYKSTTGPRLTIQPKKSRHNEGPFRSRMTQETRPVSEIAVRGNGLQQRGAPKKMPTSKPIPPPSQLHRKQIGGGGVIMVGVNNIKKQNNLAAQKPGFGPRKAASLLVVSARKQNRSGGGRQGIQASASGSSCRLPNRKLNTPYNYRIKSNPYTRPVRLGNKVVEVVEGNVTQRVASAKRMAVNDLKNRIAVLLKEGEELRKENRCLKVCQNRQNLALRKWEGRDAQLPKLLQQHRDEIKSMHVQLKKALQQCRDLDDKSKYKDRKIAKMETDLTNLRALAIKDNLKERNDLQEQVNILSANVAGGEKKIRQYMRHVEIMENNHKHEISTEKQKLIKANQHAMELRHEITGLKIALRDKDRMLNYIQMRTTGRNLLKSFQEKERQHNAKLNPAILCPDGTHSPRSRSLSPYRNPISGRTYRAQSLDRPEDFSDPRQESLQNSPRDQIEIEGLHNQNPLENPTNKEVAEVSTNIILEQGDQLHHEQQPQSGWNQNDPSIDAIGGGDGPNFPSPISEPVPTFSDPTAGPTKNAYFKMSQMLEANNPPTNHQPPVGSNTKKATPRNFKPEEKTSASPYLATAHHLKGRAVPWAPKKSSDFREAKKQPKPQPKPHPKPTFVPSTGPKTHALAKQEMKLQRELMENSTKSNIPEVEEDQRQRKKWEKVVHHQMPTRPAVSQATQMAPMPYIPMPNNNMPDYSRGVQAHPPRQEGPLPTQTAPMQNHLMSNYSSNIQAQHSPRGDPSFPPRQEIPMSTQIIPGSIPTSTSSNYLSSSYSNPSYHSQISEQGPPHRQEIPYHSPRNDPGPPPRQEVPYLSPRNDFEPPTRQDLPYHSPRSEYGPPPGQEIPYHHQYIAQSQRQALQTSAREMVPPRAFSTPQMQASQPEPHFTQLREIYSIPMVGQQGNPPENLPQTQKCIFSYSNSVPHINPQQTNQLNQPMNLPFFSTGDGPQQQGVTEIHSPQPTSHHEPPTHAPSPILRAANQTSTEYQNSQNSTANQKSPITQGTKSVAKQASHIYNPSFFAKLGTWK